MTIADWMLVLAALVGPVAAVQAQKVIEQLTNRQKAKNWIFRALMATRATRVASDHVQALNMIDLEFTGTRWRPQTKKEKEVVNRWRIYADHLNQKVDDSDKVAVREWVLKGDDLFLDLLEALTRALGYSFNRVEINRGIYFPRAHSEAERRREIVDNALMKILTGEASLPMKVTEFPVSEEALDLNLKVQTALLNAISADGLKVVESGKQKKAV